MRRWWWVVAGAAVLLVAAIARRTPAGSPGATLSTVVSEASPRPAAASERLALTATAAARAAPSPSLVSSLTIAVVDGSDAPIRDARVTVLVDGARVATGTTGRDGTCLMPVNPPWARVAVDVRAPGYASGGSRGVVSDYVRVVMTRASVVSGRVVRDDDGAGLPGITVAPYGAAEVTTGTDGEFVIDDVPRGVLWLDAWGEGWALPREVEVTVHAARVDGVVIRARAAAVISGRILHASTGLPCRRAGLRAGTEEPFRAYRAAQADARGHVTLAHALPGPIWLEAWCEDPPLRAEQETLTLPAAGIQGRTWALDGGWPSIRGRVRTASGRPVARARISAMHDDDDAPCADTRTSAEGDYLLALRSGGPVTVQVHRHGLLDEEVAARGALVLDDDAEQTLDFTLDDLASATVRGTVSHADGRPARGLRLMLDGTDYQWSSTDAAGRFEMHDLRGGRYTLQPKGRHSSFVGTSPELPLELELREGVTVDLALVLDDSHRVVGKVVDGRGEPARDVWVTVHDVQRGRVSGAVSGESITDEAGAFHIEGVSSGAHEVRARRQDGASATARVEGGGDVVLRLQPGSLSHQRPPRVGATIIRGRIVGVDGAAFQGRVYVGFSPVDPQAPSRSTRTQGEPFELSGLTEGFGRMYAQDEQGRVCIDRPVLTLPAAGVVDVVLVARPVRAPPGRAGRFGMAFEMADASGHARVSAVRPGSSASRAGIGVGSRVASVGGVAAGVADLECMMSVPPGETLVVGMASGESLVMVAE